MIAAGVVLRWVRWYTERLPAAIAERRLDEIRADLHDHISFARADGAGAFRITLSVLSRMLRGLPADVVWSGRIRPWRQDMIVKLTVALAVILVGAWAIAYGATDDAPGLVLIGLLLIVGAFALSVRAAHRRGATRL